MSPTYEQLLEWKQIYGAISKIEIEDQMFYHRTFTPSEIMAAQELEASMPNGEWMLAMSKKALLHPEEYKLELVGSIPTLYRSILNSSLPVKENGEFDLSEYLEWVKSTEKSNPAMALCIALSAKSPGLNLLQLLQTPMEWLLRMGALIEYITETSLFGTPTPEAQQTDPASQSLRRAIDKGKRGKNT